VFSVATGETKVESFNCDEDKAKCDAIKKHLLTLHEEVFLFN
jgi:hypothetical protein